MNSNKKQPNAGPFVGARLITSENKIHIWLHGHEFRITQAELIK